MNVNNSLIILLLTSLFCACSSNQTKNTEYALSDSTEESEKRVLKKELDENLISGMARLDIKDQTFELEQFDIRRTEATLQNDKISFRLTSPDQEQTIQILISGQDVYGIRPLPLSLDASLFEKADHASVGLSGFLGSKDNLSNIRLISGEGSLEKFDSESLETHFKFKGRAIHTQLKQETDTVDIGGEIVITFDDKVDTRN